MLWLKSHRRLRNALSAYVDGELSPSEALALETHIQSCEACAAELAGLRLTSAALGELPEVDAPRSFALTPGLASAPIPATQGMRSLNNGLRITGGVLAAALAVVLVMDTSGIVGEGGEENSEAALQMGAMAYSDDSAPAEENVLQELGPDAVDGYLASGSPVPLETPAPTGAAGGGSGGVLVPSGAAETPLDGSPGSRGIPAPLPTQTAATEAPAGGDADAAQPSTAQTPMGEALKDTDVQSPAAGDLSAQMELDGGQERDTGTLNGLEATDDSYWGLSALTVTEIVLAVLLGMSIVGIGAATYAERRRR